MGMRLFKKANKSGGWMAISLAGDSINVAHILRSPSGKPVVTLAATYGSMGSSIETSLQSLAKECHAERYQCTTLLAPSEYQILAVDSPTVPPAELKTAIRWRLKDMLDYHIDDATIDVLDIPQDKNAPARSHSMYAIAAPSRSVDRLQTLFGQAKIPLSVIDIPETAQRNIAALVEPEGRGVAMLSFDTEGGLLTFSAGGELYMARHIDVALPQLAQSESEQKAVALDRIILELQRSLDHFDRQYHYVALAKLVLAPIGSPGIGLQEYLAENLYIPVESLNLETVLDLSKVPTLKRPDEQQRHFMTLGAALRHEEMAL
jgi:MSHA biogenesis protein MshI